MRTSTVFHKQERVHGSREPKGNWMHLTIAPLVEEMLDDEQPLPGTAGELDKSGSFVGAPGGAGLADDNSA